MKKSAKKPVKTKATKHTTDTLDDAAALLILETNPADNARDDRHGHSR